MGVASSVRSRSVQSASLQACLSTTRLDGRCLIRPYSTAANQPTVTLTPGNDNQEKIDFQQTIIDFQEKNDFNIPTHNTHSASRHHTPAVSSIVIEDPAANMLVKQKPKKHVFTLLSCTSTVKDWSCLMPIKSKQ